MNQAIKNAYNKWAKGAVMSPMGGALPRYQVLSLQGNGELANAAFEGGYYAGQKSAHSPISKLVAEFSTQDYDESHLQELLARLSSILNPEKP